MWKREPRGTTHNNVVHIVFLDLGCEIDIDFDSVLSILLFDGVKQRVEPFGNPKVTDDPCEVDLETDA